MSLKEKLSKLFSEDIDLASDFMHEDGELPDTTEFMRVVGKLVDSYGGEDCGSTYYAVYSFTEKNKSVYIKFNGWYASHYGSEYQSFEFVTPQQRTITVYE